MARFPMLLTPCVVQTPARLTSCSWMRATMTSCCPPARRVRALAMNLPPVLLERSSALPRAGCFGGAWLN